MTFFSYLGLTEYNFIMLVSKYEGQEISNFEDVPPKMQISRMVLFFIPAY